MLYFAIEVAANRINRWACGHAMVDKIRNEKIREKLMILSLKVKCRQARLRWYGDVERKRRTACG